MDTKKIVDEFSRIKNLGFVKSNRSKTNDGSIGNTFEDHLGVTENNAKDPDFEGFEVKSQRELTGSKISLFTKSPSGPKGANAYLKDNFGRGDAKFPNLKALHSSMFGNRWNSVFETYKMKLIVDREDEKVVLHIKDNNDILLSNHVHWSFEDLQAASKKMSSLFVVFAASKKIDDLEYFHYNKAIIYHNLVFDKFLELLEAGYIMFDLRMGVYKSGKSIGKPHDHGSGFRVDKEYIALLYQTIIEISD
ncbi:MAG: hypothetical protein A3K10_14635 [Bacteroidetes bacterium RIFCSPLOWO2_12_FULL_31_6]|nr:MAG: hypothetical protein A3K10_14635 [Bacteroidetes bacterium RIFCSPLOWO2_12_FULL_31_6]